MSERVIGWREQLEMMEYLASCSGFSDYETVREAMSAALFEKYKKKASDLFTYEPMPDNEVRQFKDWLLSDE